MKKKIILIDGNSILHRSYHAIPGLKSSKGQLTNGIFGFFSIILSLIEKEKPDYMAVAFDAGKKTFRNREFKDYKATRPKAPQELYDQLPIIKEILAAFNIPYFLHDDFEADDVIGTLAEQSHENGHLLCIIITSDMDALQLVREDVYVAAPKGFSNSIYFTSKEVREKYGLSPDKIIDYKGLKGDPSDNIPGVKGVGGKTAVSLINDYHHLENIYENLTKIKGSLRKKLEDHKEMAFLSKRMATIVRDGPFKLDLDKCRVGENMNLSEVIKLFLEYDLKSLKIRFEKIFGRQDEGDLKSDSGLNRKEKNNIQISLF